MRFNKKHLPHNVHMSLNNTTHAVAASNASLPAVIALVLLIYAVFVVSLCERNNKNKKKIQYHSAEGYDCCRYATA
jgi:hypothetical protein